MYRVLVHRTRALHACPAHMCIARSSTAHVYCMFVQRARALHACVERPARKLAPTFICLHYIQSADQLPAYTQPRNHITFHTPTAYPPPPEDLGGGPPDGEGHPHHIHPVALTGRLERHPRGGQATCLPPSAGGTGGGASSALQLWG